MVCTFQLVLVGVQLLQQLIGLFELLSKLIVEQLVADLYQVGSVILVAVQGRGMLLQQPFLLLQLPLAVLQSLCQLPDGFVVFSYLPMQVLELRLDHAFAPVPHLLQAVAAISARTSGNIRGGLGAGVVPFWSNCPHLHLLLSIIWIRQEQEGSQGPRETSNNNGWHNLLHAMRFISSE